MAHFPTKGLTDAPESGPPPEAISMSKGYAAARAIANRSSLRWAPGAMMTSGARLLPRTLSGFTFLPQPGSVLMFMTCVVNKGHTDAWDLAVTSSHVGVPGPCQPLWPELPPQITVVIQVRAAAESPVWVHDPTAARV